MLHQLVGEVVKKSHPLLVLDWGSTTVDIYINMVLLKEDHGIRVYNLCPQVASPRYSECVLHTLI